MSALLNPFPREGPPVVSVIGGGVSGCLVAAQLLRNARAPLHVLLFERSAEVGGGVAYGAAGDEHRLNAPAARMGAWPEAADDFLRWVHLEPDGASADAGDFLPRRLYRRYIAATLARSRAEAALGVTLEIVHAEVFDVRELPGGGGRVHASGLPPRDAAHVVLALGNLPGEYPVRKPLPFYHGARYAHVPWAPGALYGIGPDDDVLLVGQGLTAIDTMLTLARRGHRGVIHALSRRGLRPQPHRIVPPRALFIDTQNPPRTIRDLVRRVRSEIVVATAEGGDWRAVIDALRPATSALWRALPLEERARFLRHVRPHWEAHRHRLAPAIHAELESLIAAGRIRLHAARVESLEDAGTHAAVVARVRGRAERLQLQVARVVNCTGPRSDYSKFQHPLLVNLLSHGLIDHDPLALGIAAEPDGRVLRYRKGPIDWLHTLGPTMIGVLWETTAVPEIRVQAAALARRVLASLEGAAPAAAPGRDSA